jgi:thiamine biosynthesis lipoprotein
MGMQARVVVYAPDEPRARRAASAAFRRIGALDAALSDYRRESELMRLCDHAGKGPVKVSADLFRVLSRAQELAKWSDGAFDVTCGPVVALWRQARRTGRLPSDADRQAALKLVGWRNVVLHPTRREVELKMPGMRLDMGGIAKGYACDAAMKEIRWYGLRRAMVEMGGDLVVGDPPPGKPGWAIEIPNADDPLDRLQYLSGMAVSTSGDTEQWVEIGGKRYSHIVDPRTGMGLTSRTAVTVIARRGEISDGLSTALSVLGEDAGRELARRFGALSVYTRKAD